MPVNLSIKNAPDAIVDRLRQRAARSHRSLQGEVMAILEEAVREEHGAGWLAAFAAYYMGHKRTCDLADTCTLPSLSAEIERGAMRASVRAGEGFIDGRCR